MIGLILTLALIGLALYLIETFIPMDATIKQIIRIVVIICVILYLLSVFGVLGRLDAPIPRV